MKYCLIIPHYNHANELIQFLPKLQSLDLPIILVDDGSDADQLTKVKDAIVSLTGIYLTEHKKNRGKGAAVKP